MVVVGNHLGQCLPRVVRGSLYTVWHGELLLKTRNGEGEKKKKERKKERYVKNIIQGVRNKTFAECSVLADIKSQSFVGEG